MTEDLSVSVIAAVTALSTFKLQLPPEEVVGDPCLPEPWDFLTCNSESPPRVSSMYKPLMPFHLMNEQHNKEIDVEI